MISVLWPLGFIIFCRCYSMKNAMSLTCMITLVIIFLRIHIAAACTCHGSAFSDEIMLTSER